MVQAWYQGGLSVFDFTDSTKPVEIAYFDRGPLDARNLITGGYWSTYWYNGHIYGSEMARGLDVFKLLPSEYLSENEIEAATLVRPGVFNAQQQIKVVWPAASPVARAYLDQLARTHGIKPERAAAIKTRARARRQGAQRERQGRGRGGRAVEGAGGAGHRGCERRHGAGCDAVEGTGRHADWTERGVVNDAVGLRVVRPAQS